MAVSKIKIDEQRKSPPDKPGTQPDPQFGSSFSNQIVILFSAPLLTKKGKTLESLAIQKEIDAIAEVLEEIQIPLELEIVVKVATSTKIQDVFSSRVKPLIIHFIGHGMEAADNSTALVLEDEVGLTRSFTESELKIALSNYNQAPSQVVLLNACHSEKLAKAFEDVGVPHVIGINAEDKIIDEAARCFSRRLYQALFNGQSIVDAFLQSRNAVKLNDKLRQKFNRQTFKQGISFDEAFKYVLLPKNQSHNESLIVEKADKHQIISPKWFNTNISRDNPSFVGRRQEIHKVIKILVESDKRCIALHGMGGIGKTELAKGIGRWLHERNRYKDGVWFISLRDTDSVGTLIVKIQEILELKTLSLKKELRDKRIFLIFDDLDLLIQKEAQELIDLLNTLLEQCFNLRLLLTVRDAIAREIIDCQQQEVYSMGVYETKEIFKKYAPPESEWGNDNLSTDFKRLANFLDGYPLAIKLAASYMVETQSTLKMLCEDLDIEPLNVLASYSRQERKERSLSRTLERSFEILSVQAQDLFPLLAFFPSGLNRDLARGVWGINGQRTLMELLKYSMAEKSDIVASDWRVNLPEPARAYAETKLQQERGLDYLAPQVLAYYAENFCDRIIKLFENGDNKKAQNLLLQENSNLILFLEWGYKFETNQICFSARITASLSPYWRWIEANTDPKARLNSAILAAQRNSDREAENLVQNAIAVLDTQEPFKDVQTIAEEAQVLKESGEFQFQVVRIDRQGKEINREEKSTEYFREDLGNDVTLDMIAIPGGSFTMGAPEEELDSSGYEIPQHQVNVSSFFIGRYPITQAQWKVVAEWDKVERDLDPDPSLFKEDYEGITRWNRPVEKVSWDDAIEFCKRLSNKTKREYRLPSEAQWEYACRAGTTTPFPFGETISAELANYNGTWTYGQGVKGEYREQTTPVGYFKVANNFGLYDMHGNVYEWCEDDWHNNYDNAPNDGTAWTSKNSSIKVIRGGSWNGYPFLCRSAFRDNYYPGNRFYYIGFRVVRLAPRTS